ncbi:MAG: protein phosphatase [bacterium]|nr:protein phosphatase [bacterium]
MKPKICRFICIAILVSSFGCGPGDTTGRVEMEQALNDENATQQGFPGFSWVVPGELAAMPLPGKERPLAHDAAYLRENGISLLISLTEEPPDGSVLEDVGIGQLRIPVRDFTAPTLEQINEFVSSVAMSATDGELVGVHCTAGLGRSGTMAAAYLVSKGDSAEVAIATLRQLRPGSVETEAQEEAVKAYELSLSSPE